MKKALSVILVLIMLLCLSSCSIAELKNKMVGTKSITIPIGDETGTSGSQLVIIDATSAPAPENNQSVDASAQPVRENTTAAPDVTSPQQNYTESTTNPVKTYYTDDPNNKYIVAISNYFKVDKSCLVAFVRKNSKIPGATVLQFSGKKDSNGKLLTTTEELRYVYDISDNGEVYKTNKDGTDVIGYNQLAGKAAYMLVEKYIMPDIEKFKTENRLED